VTKLARVIISSTYGGLLPASMARLHPGVVESFYSIVRDVKAAGGRLLISDMFRPRRVQADLKRRKPRLAAASGKSYHEAGLAFDLSVGQLHLTLDQFRAIVRRHGWETISKENWHIQYSYRALGYRTLQAAIKDVDNWAG